MNPVVGWSFQRSFLAMVVTSVMGVLVSGGSHAAVEVPRPPNVVLLYADDLGYGDLGCYGRKDIRTPHLDQLARDGTRFTDFCVPQAVCSASRAALLTGCLPNRVGVLGALFPGSPVGLNPNETTLGELFQSRGYATAMMGKWHLGDTPAFNPVRHGFDEWFGLPYSNDMWPEHPTKKDFPPLPLMDGMAVVDAHVGPEDQARLTSRYTERAVRFIERTQDRPFFLYVAYAMPHVPLFASEGFRGRSAAGPYGDAVEEVDDSVGRIVGALRAQGIDRETVVIFASDNGPWLAYGNHAGSSGGLREGKGTSWEGGVRVPMILSWPGHVPAGRVYAGFASTVDLFPTLAAWIHAPLPDGRVLDGRDLSEAWTDAAAPEPQASFFPGYYNGGLNSMRLGPWKRVVPHTYQHLEHPGSGGLPGPGAYAPAQATAALYHLGEDPGETRDVSSEHRDVVNKIDEEMGRIRGFLGDSNRKITGIAVRPAGSADALFVRPGPDGVVTLGATNALVHGIDLHYEHNARRNGLMGWTRLTDWVEWEFQIDKPGRYSVEVLQASDLDSPGAEMELRVNGEVKRFSMTPGYVGFDLIPLKVGTVTFPAGGRHVLELRVVGNVVRRVGSIMGVVLTPAEP